MDDRWLTAGQAAVVFKVHIKTIRDWTDKGKLPSSRTLGGHRRYDRADVEQLAEEMRDE